MANFRPAAQQDAALANAQPVSAAEAQLARVAGEGVAPDALEQLIAGQNEATVVEQLPEEVELLRGELDLIGSDFHLSPAGVDAEIAVPELLALVAAPLGRGAAQNRLYARDELTGVERLRQVVVRADLEAELV